MIGRFAKHPPAPAGRVVLQSRTATPNRVALEAAVHLAKAFRFQIESVFVEDQDVLTLADLPFATEISTTGRRTPITDFAEMERTMRLASAALQRSLDQLVQAHAIACEFKTVRGDASRALAQYCDDACFVVMAETFTPSDMLLLRHLIETAKGLNGALLVGPQARDTAGPIVMIAEDARSLECLATAAKRVAQERRDGDIVALVLSDDVSDQQIADAFATGAADVHYQVVRPKQGARSPSTIARIVHQLQGSITVARLGGFLQPGDGRLSALTNTLATPLLLLR
ncbi:MAG: hypothetical protein ACR2O4_07780 [Hyphomicrobiaceae bacterium]